MAGEALKCLADMDELLTNKLWLMDGRSMSVRNFKYSPSGQTILEPQEQFASSCRVFEVPFLSWNEVKTWQKENKPYELIDVREINEHQISNAGGRNIPLSTLNLYMPELIGLKKPLVFYCKSGQRSSRAVHDLLEDFEELNLDAFSLQGGMNSLHD
jgi:adenylyltransferase/sulfurtransferase